MTVQKLFLVPEHGGEVDAAAEHYGIPRDQWLDLSTGINPKPYPLPELAREYWHRLPDGSLDSWLRESAASYYRVPDPEKVIPAPGSQALIQFLPRLFPPTQVAVVTPTYREHLACWSASQHRVLEIRAPEDTPEGAGVLVVANPNNPDGRLFNPDHLLRLCEKHLVIVDEAFADVMPNISVAPHAGHPNLVVLRSFGKFFGLAGMRLGFALTNDDMAGRLRRALGPWAVSGPAAAIGAVALADEPWARAARVRLTAAAGRLDGLLMRAGLRIAGGTSLFRLVENVAAPDVFEALARAGILVRRFESRPHWIRFGIPGDDEAFERLREALAGWRAQSASSTQPGFPAGDRPCAADSDASGSRPRNTLGFG